MSSGTHQLFDPESPPTDTALSPTEAGGHASVLSIGGLYDEVEQALASVFPRRRQLWVRGEIQSLSDQTGRSGHCYLDLVDPADEGGSGRGRGAPPALKVKCWKGTWGPMRSDLAREGITLAEGMVVIFRGSLDLYRPKGEIGFILSELDVTALLGRLAAQRAALLRALESEGLLRRNATVPVPDVPLRVGLVASPGTEGYRDFLGQLTSSEFGFHVRVVPVTVQGADAPAAVANAITALCRTEYDCDVVAVVRGGGSKADLATFDAEVVARAIALATKPIWTGIGHTGDESVADIVANRACITPTECGHQLVNHVGLWWDTHVAAPTALLSRRAQILLSDAQNRDAQARGRLTRAARHQLVVHRERLIGRTTTLARLAPESLTVRHGALRTHAARLGPLTLGHLAQESERVRSWRRLLTAYDVDRQLERGYTLTTTPDGQLVRSAAALAHGQSIVTRFADGTVQSDVSAVEVRSRNNIEDAAEEEEET